MSEGTKFYETLDKFQSDFVKQTSHETRRKCAAQFRQYIESESRTKTVEEFTSFLQEINRTLVLLIGSSNVAEKLCGMYLLDELIEVPYEENEIKITRFAQHLRMIYATTSEFNLYLYQCATSVFGHLVRVGGVLVSDLIVGEARKALEQLRSDKPERIVPSLLILKTLAENAPSIFSPYLDSCIDSLWPALHSSNENVRDCALDTLHQCILLVNTRLPSQRDQLYTRIHTEILGLFKLNTADAIQGGLRAIALLFTYGGDFLLPYFNKVLELITQHKEHRERAVRDTVIMLIPTLIAYSPSSFQTGTQLPSLISHVIAVLHKATHESSASSAYISLGKIALHTGQALLYKLDVIANLIKDGLKKKTKASMSSVLSCLSMLSRALGLALLPYATDLVDLLFEGGLSPSLVQTLSELAQNLPVLLPSIQSRLLSAISLILSQVDLNNNASTKSTAASLLSRAGLLVSSNTSSLTSDDFDPNSPTGLISLALDTLGQFDFTGHNLLPFVYQRVLPWLNVVDSKLRSQTARCCLNIVLRAPSNPLKLQISHYFKMQDIIFAIQDQIQLQQKLLIVIAGDGALDQYRAEQNDDDFDQDGLNAPKHWTNNSEQEGLLNSSGRQTRAGSLSISNSRLLTMDLQRKSTTTMIKPVLPDSASSMNQIVPAPVRPGALNPSPMIPATGDAPLHTPAALRRIAEQLKSGKYRSNSANTAKKYCANSNAFDTNIAPFDKFYHPSNVEQQQHYGVELFKNLLKVQLQVLTQLHVQMELFLSLQKQNFNNFSTFGSSLYGSMANVDPGAQVAGGHRINPSTTTTLAQTLTQDAHQLLAQIQVAQLQVQQEQQLVLQAQATGIDLSGIAHSAIWDHLKRHKKRVKQHRASAASAHSIAGGYGNDGYLAYNTLPPPQEIDNTTISHQTRQQQYHMQNIDQKHESDSQILIKAYISSGMALELGIVDLANSQNPSNNNPTNTTVSYIHNIAQCVLHDQSFGGNINPNNSGSVGNPNAQTNGTAGQANDHEDYDNVNIQNLLKGWTPMVNEVLTRLTTITVSDPDPTIRYNVLSLLTPQFDVYLSQPHHLATLINVLKDPQLDNKCVALTILSRLMPLNPVLVLPILRHYVTEVVYQLQLSGSPKVREDSAAILTHIATHAHTFIKPYSIPILKVLVRVLFDTMNPSVASAILTAIGETTLTAGSDAYPIVAPILPILFCIIYNKESHTVQTKNATGSTSNSTGTGPGSDGKPTTQSSSSTSSSQSSSRGAKDTPASSTTTTSTTAQQARNTNVPPVIALLQGQTQVIGISHYIALRCLRLVCSACGLAMVPYHIFPSLLSTLIRIVSGTLSTQARNEAVQLIGVVGAIDPFTAKLLQTHSQQVTLREMMSILMKGLQHLYSTTSNNFLTIAMSSNDGPTNKNQKQSTEMANTADGIAATLASNFIKSTVTMLKGIKIEPDVLDDEVLKMLLFSKASQLQDLLQQIRLIKSSSIGLDYDNDGTLQSSLIAEQRYIKHNAVAENIPFQYNQHTNTVIPTETNYDKLYTALNQISAGDSDAMYSAYLMYDDYQANVDASQWENNNDESNTNIFSPGTGNGNEQQYDEYNNPYNLQYILKNKDKVKNKDNNTINNMNQLLASAVAQGSATTTASSSTTNNNNILQLIKLPQPQTEVQLGLVIAGADFYRLTAVHALVDILMESQSQSHRKAVIALMFIFKTTGSDCYKLLPHMVPAFAQALTYHNDDLRPLILEQLGVMALLTTKHFKTYISPILQLLLLNWTMVNSIPQHVFWLIQRMSRVDTNEIQIYMPDLLPKMLNILLTDKSPDRDLSQHVLRALQSLVACLEPYLHMILPALSNVWALGSDSPSKVRCLSLHTTAQLIRSVPSLQHVPRLVLPLLELIQASDHVTTTNTPQTPAARTASDTTPVLMNEVLQTLCVIIHQMGPKYSKHILATQNLLQSKNINHVGLSNLFTRILSQIPLSKTDLPPALPCWKNDNIDTIKEQYSGSNPYAIYDDVWISELGLNRQSFITTTMSVKQPGTKESNTVTVIEKLPVNQPALVKIWDTSQRLTSDDWSEWMKGVCVAMLKESPFPPLRACSVLAQKDYALARTLFTVGFASCWNELNDVYQDAIINALDNALKSPTTPSDVLSALLSLCEFMEHDDRPLPLDIRQLAHLSATKCHSFAKALHYKEHEFFTSSQPSLLLEDLISTHNKLQQPQAAIGILKMATSLPEFRGSLQENWYEQLHRWDQALAAYERKQLNEGLLIERDNSNNSRVAELDPAVLAMLQQTHTRNRFQNGSVLGSIVGANTYSLTNTLGGLMENTGDANTAQRGAGATSQLLPAASQQNGIRVNGVLVDTILGRLRCLKALGDYDRVARISIDLWNQLQHVTLALQRNVQELQSRGLFNLDAASPVAGKQVPPPPPPPPQPFGGFKASTPPPAPPSAATPSARDTPIIPSHISYELNLLPDLMSEVASLACEALHMLGKWDDLPPFFTALSPQILDRSFYSVIYNIHIGNLTQAEMYLREAKKLVQNDIYALLGEGYNRAYSSIVGIQLLTELEEVVNYKRLGGHLSTSHMITTGSQHASHAQSHTHALSLAKMKVHDTNNNMTYLHNINPLTQSTLNHQLSQQLQSQYATGFGLVSHAMSTHAAPQHVGPHYDAALLANAQYLYYQQHGVETVVSNTVTSNSIHHSQNPAHKQQLTNRGYFNNSQYYANYYIANNSEYLSKPSITTPAHLTQNAMSWNELLARTQQRALLRTVWSQRIKSVQRNPYVWRHLLATRSLVLTPQQNTKFWIQYAHMTSNMGRYDHSLDIIKKLLRRNPHQAPLDYELHLRYLQYEKHMNLPTSKNYTLTHAAPAFNLNKPASPLASTAHRPSKLMYLPTPKTVLSAVTQTQPNDEHTQLLCDIFSFQNPSASTITYDENTPIFPKASYQFSFGVASPFNFMKDEKLALPALPPPNSALITAVGTPNSTQTALSAKLQAVRQHYYQQQQFGFNMASTQHPLLSVGTVAVSPITLAIAHHTQSAILQDSSSPCTSTLSKTPSSTPMASPDDVQANKAKFNSSYIAYPCVLDDFHVALAYCQHIWKVGYRTQALDRLSYLTQLLEYLLGFTSRSHNDLHHNVDAYLTHTHGKDYMKTVPSPHEICPHESGDVIYVKHHRFCPHHPLYHTLSQQQIALHETSQQFQNNNPNYIPLVCMLSVCPPPQYSNTSKDKDDDAHWYPMVPLRPTQRETLTSLCSKINRIIGDWGLSLLSSVSPTFGISFEGAVKVDATATKTMHEDTSSSSPLNNENIVTILDLTRLPRVNRNIAETFALSATLEAYQRSTLYSPYKYKGWHGWAAIHYRAAQIIRLTKQSVAVTLKQARRQFLVAATGVDTQKQRNIINSAKPFTTLHSHLSPPTQQQSHPHQQLATEEQLKLYKAQILNLVHDYDSLNKHLHLHVVAAITGFLHSISLANDTSQSLQELLRVLSLWFSHGNMTSRKLDSTVTTTSYHDVVALPPSILGQNKLPSIADVLRQGFNTLPITTWVVVSPQIIARLHSTSAKGTIRVLIQELLLMIGRYHPQALVYPLTVAVKSEQQSPIQTIKQHVVSVSLHRGLTVYGPRKGDKIQQQTQHALTTSYNAYNTQPTNIQSHMGMIHDPNHQLLALQQKKESQQQQQKSKTHNTAMQVMSALRSISPLLIEQAMVVSRELIRAAVLWNELWHESLEEASRLWFTQQDPMAMLALILPLHQKIGLGSHSFTQIATNPMQYYIPSSHNVSQLITTLPSFQINSKSLSSATSGAFNTGSNLHQNFFSGPETPREIAFVHMFGRELAIAHDFCMKYLARMVEDELDIDPTQMWYNGEVIIQQKKDFEGYQPGVQFFHPSRKGIQAMNDFMIEQHELHQQFMSSKNNSHVTPAPPSTSTIVANIKDATNTVSTKQKKHLPYASDLNQAWSIYCTVFRQLNKMITQGGESAQFFELHDISPILLSCRDLVLAIPGTYDPKHYTNTVCISRVISYFKIIESKQRPRKLSIIGSDGEEHSYLLKGHEDLRQDTRVMQLFDLVNALLSSGNNNTSTTNDGVGAGADDDTHGGDDASGSNSNTLSSGMGSGNSNSTNSLSASSSQGSGGELELNLRGYSVTPLSPVSGVIQWLSNCDTLHALIKDYREARYVLLNTENKLMAQVSLNWQNLCLLQKVEVFEYSQANTSGRDLADVLWLKSSTSEQWLERRGNYTRSLAVTSIVGYILGLGDRHPCNLMLDRTSAKVIHIDFGDCFEVAQHRDKFPERVPFRLTRILIRALEVSGIEGTFRLTCEYVMKVLRNSKESVMAVLEAFIYDPLITWRLINDENATVANANANNDDNEGDDNNKEGDDNKDNNNTKPNGTASSISSSITVKSLTSTISSTSQSNSVKPSTQMLIDAINTSVKSILKNDDDNNNTMFNAKALSVIERIESKLNGTDFHSRWSIHIQQRHQRITKDNSTSNTGATTSTTSASSNASNKIKCILGFGIDAVISPDGFNKKLDNNILSATEQVEHLIQCATSTVNLSTAYLGWCAFW